LSSLFFALTVLFSALPAQSSVLVEWQEIQLPVYRMKAIDLDYFNFSNWPTRSQAFVLTHFQNKWWNYHVIYVMTEDLMLREVNMWDIMDNGLGLKAIAGNNDKIVGEVTFYVVVTTDNRLFWADIWYPGWQAIPGVRGRDVSFDGSGKYLCVLSEDGETVSYYYWPSMEQIKTEILPKPSICLSMRRGAAYCVTAPSGPSNEQWAFGVENGNCFNLPYTPGSYPYITDMGTIHYHSLNSQNLWVIDNRKTKWGGNIWLRDIPSNSWISANGLLTKISVDRNGNPLGINGEGKVFWGRIVR